MLGIQNVCEGSSKWDRLQSSYQLLQPGGSSLPGFLGPWVWDYQCCAAGNLSCLGEKSNSSPDPGTAERCWSTGQARMFSTGGWKIARGVNNYPFPKQREPCPHLLLFDTGEPQAWNRGSANGHPFSGRESCRQVCCWTILALHILLLGKWEILIPRVDGVNAVELTKKVRSHAAAAPATLPAAPKVLCHLFIVW